jgi:hypothetical protein
MEEPQPKAKPNLYARIRAMDKRLRVMLIATALLIIPQIGQFLTIRDLNTSGQESGLALFFMFAGIIVIPTSAILTGAILAVIRKQWRRHERLVILGVINSLIILNLAWFLVDQCSWSQVFGLTLKVCSS